MGRTLFLFVAIFIFFLFLPVWSPSPVLAQLIEEPTPEPTPIPTEQPTPEPTLSDNPTPTPTPTEPEPQLPQTGNTETKQESSSSCSNERPGSAPILTSAQTLQGGVKLTWIQATDPVTHYLVAYGASPTVMEYGSPNIGGRGTTSFTVSQLRNGVKYYFKVRGENGCKAGEFSNKLSAVPGSNANSSIGLNLSIYKTNTTDSALISTEEEKVMGASTSILPTTCQRCMGWQLLGTEAFLLFVYFYIANKFRAFNKIASVFIPVAIYLLFLKINGACPSNNFLCNYFLQLNILMFIFFVIAQKYKAVHPKPAI